MLGNEVSVNKKYIYISFIIFAFVTSFFGTMSSPFYPINYWVDPNAYFTMAKCWINGYIPYKDYFDHKGPFLYIIYAIGCLISDTSFSGIYIIQSIGLAITLIFVYKIAELFIKAPYTYIATLCSGVLFFTANVKGGSTEELIIPLQSISFYLFLKQFADRYNPFNNKYMFIHGIFIGIVALIKFTILVFWIFPICAIFLQLILDKRFRDFFVYLGYLLTGILLATIPILLYYYLNGALSDLISNYITFNLLYGGMLYSRILTIYIIMLQSIPIMMLFIFIGLIYFFFFTKDIKSWLYKLSIPLCAYVFILMITGSYFPNLYNMLVLYIIAAFGIIITLKIIQNRIKINNSILIYTTSFIICIALVLFIKKDYINNADRRTFLQEFSEIIKQDNEDQSLFCVGLDAGVYLEMDVLPSFKYYYNPNIAYEKYPEIIDSQNEYIQNNKPRYVILDAQNNWYYPYFEESLKDDYIFLKTLNGFENNDIGFKYSLFKRK